MNVLYVLLALWLSPLSPQTLQTVDPNRVDDVRVEGNRRIPSDTIKYNLQTKAGDLLNPATIARDIKTLYALSYFDDIRVEEQDAQRGKTVIFRVKEKPLMRSIEFEGIKSITRSDILDKLRTQKAALGQESPYDATKVRRAETVIKSMLAEKGHQNATVVATTEPIPPNAVAVTFVVDEGPKIKIEEIVIEGNRAFSEGKVKSAMKLVKEVGPLTAITGKDTYHDLKLADDLTRIRLFYMENGYMRINVLDPIVETKPKTIHRTLPFIKPPFPWGIPLPFWTKKVDRYYVTIKLEENNQYKVGDVKITGNKEIPAEIIKAVLGLAPGAVYNDSLMRKGFDNLKKVYGGRGYINFTPVPMYDFDEERKLVNLTIDIDEDRQFFVNRIAFAGNTTTRDKVIRREILVDEGQVFNSQLWDISLLRLNQLGYFEEIKTEDAEVKPDPNDAEVDITLKVREKGRNSIGFNGGVSGVGGSFLGLDYSTNNFLGFGETLSVSIQGGTRQSNFVFSFTEPYMFDRPLSSGFSLFSTNYRYDQAREVLGLDPATLPEGFENRLNYEQRRAGFTFYGSYPLKLFQRLGLTYSWENSSTSAVNPATQEYFQAVTSQERASFVTGSGSFDKFKSRKLIPTYSYSTVDQPMNPRRGQALTTSFDFTGGFLGGNVNYYRPSFEYRFFTPSMKRQNVIALRVSGSHIRGFSNVSVPFYERIFMGGDYDIRGFDFRAISPISFIARSIATVDPETGNPVNRLFDDIVYVGGDTQAVMNLEYRIPIVGPITLAPFLDLGNSWVINRKQLQRELVDGEGNRRLEGVQFLPGTNSGIRASTGVEVNVVMPVLNAPFRLIFAYNPFRIDRGYIGPVTGSPFFIQEKKRDIKFTVGRTF